MKIHRRLAALATAALIAAASVPADAATLSGTLTDDAGKPLPGARVTVPALKKGVLTDANGKYALDVPAGGYAVEFDKDQYGGTSKQIQVPGAGATADVSLKSAAPIELAPITITAAPKPATTFNSPSSVSVVEGRQMDRARGQSVMSAIQDVPGVNMEDEGPTVVKPVINGMQGQDLVIARDGVREEFIQWGNEHAPEIDSMSSDIIEVLRGPNSLMYGSDAIGGVISIRQPDLPNAALGSGPLSGKIMADVHSVNDSVGQAAMLQGAEGDWGWRTDLSARNAGNFSTPDEGVIPNTAEHETSGDGTLELRKSWGDVTANASRFDKNVQLQNGFVYPNPLLDTEYQVLIHDHGTLKANILTDYARWELIAGYDRSDRTEYNGQAGYGNGAPTTQVGDVGDISAHWIETSYTADVKAHLEPMGPFQGTLGFSGERRVEQQLTPDTHLTPGYNLDGAGEYLYEELPLGNWTFSAGIRADQDHYSIDNDPEVGAGSPTALPPPPGVQGGSLNYSAVTGAIGGVYHITDPLAFALNVGRGFRNPVPFELYGYGVHEGAGVFQIGDSGLKPEVSLNTNAELRWQSDAVKGTVGVFRNYIQDYIYGSYANLGTSPQCAAGSGYIYDSTVGGCLPVVKETQANATIQGVDYAVRGAAADWLTLSSEGNLVRGYNDSGDASLNGNVWIPHVPADNIKFGAELHEKSLGVMKNPYFGADLKLTAPQRRASPNELSTAGYGVVGLHTGAEFAVLGNRTTLDAGVDNLLNQGYIDYNSILKDFNIENPGRDIYVKLTVPFGS
jgi:iron complex outermembrane receptor protein